MDLFERLTGFPERTYAQTRDRLDVIGKTLRSTINGAAFGIGEFELVALDTLRGRVAMLGGPAGRPRVSIVQGDMRTMHQAREYEGALFQVASQTNCLEMVGPDVTPEDGITRYEYDRTQGPACALITAHIEALDERARSDLAGKLRIGIHRDVEVTDSPSRPGPLVSQAFCSALRWHTAASLAPTDRPSRSSYSMPPTRQPCWKPCSTPSAARRTSCC